MSILRLQICAKHQSLSRFLLYLSRLTTHFKQHSARTMYGHIIYSDAANKLYIHFYTLYTAILRIYMCLCVNVRTVYDTHIKGEQL